MSDYVKGLLYAARARKPDRYGMWSFTALRGVSRIDDIMSKAPECHRVMSTGLNPVFKCGRVDYDPTTFIWGIADRSAFIEAMLDYFGMPVSFDDPIVVNQARRGLFEYVLYNWAVPYTIRPDNTLAFMLDAVGDGFVDPPSAECWGYWTVAGDTADDCPPLMNAWYPRLKCAEIDKASALRGMLKALHESMPEHWTYPNNDCERVLNMLRQCGMNGVMLWKQYVGQYDTGRVLGITTHDAHCRDMKAKGVDVHC